MLNRNRRTVLDILPNVLSTRRDLQTTTINRLLQNVGSYFHEISSSPYREAIVAFVDSPETPVDERQSAALLLSQVYYHLDQINEALRYALLADEKFDVTSNTTFVGVVSDVAVSKYGALQCEKYDFPSREVHIDESLTKLYDRLIDQSIEAGQYHSTVGLAIESRRVDIIERCLVESKSNALREECFHLAMKYVVNRQFQHEILTIVVRSFRAAKTLGTTEPNDVFWIATCHCVLDEGDELANLITSLVEEDTQPSLARALQIAFDVNESGTQALCRTVFDRLHVASSELDENSEKYNKYKLIMDILSSVKPTEIELKFMSSHNKTDPLDITDLRTCSPHFQQLLQIGSLLSHGLMNCGTMSDFFIRSNNDWLFQAQYWAQFPIVASTGMVHKGHTTGAFNLLKDFLPWTQATASKYREERLRNNLPDEVGTQNTTNPLDPKMSYSQAGALFALGLVHGQNGAELMPYLMDMFNDIQTQFGAAQEEHLQKTRDILLYGLCLTLGCACIGNGDELVTEIFDSVINQNSVHAAEAAGIGYGLVLLGTGNMDMVQRLIDFANRTPHEKVQRGLLIGASLICIGVGEIAETAILQLSTSTNSIFRFGAALMMGLAFYSTAKDSVVGGLLKMAATDPNGDVQRQSVISLGFLFAESMARDVFPRTALPLCDSFNGQIRAGAAIALGIVNSARPTTDVITLLKLLCEDKVGYVRECGAIGLGLVMMQQSESTSPLYKDIPTLLRSIMFEKKADAIARFGAQIGLGIMNAGGRNTRIQTVTTERKLCLVPIAGLALFTQFWHWHSNVLFLTFALRPTALSGVDVNMKITAIDFESSVPTKTFGYPAMRVKEVDKKDGKKTTKVQLSVTKPTVEGDKEEGMLKDENAEKTEEEKREEEKKKEEEEKKKEEEETPPFILHNPIRVIASQQPTIRFITEEARYIPVRTDRTDGIVVFIDTKPDLPPELSRGTLAEVDTEMRPPDRIEFVDDDD